jgi:hypothetical protein
MNDNIRENKIIASGSLGNEHAWVDESGASVRRADSHEYFVELADAAKGNAGKFGRRRRKMAFS